MIRHVNNPRSYFDSCSLIIILRENQILVCINIYIQKDTSHYFCYYQIPHKEMSLRYPERKRLPTLHLKDMLVHKMVLMLNYILKSTIFRISVMHPLYFTMNVILQIVLTRRTVTVLVMSFLNK